MGTRRLTLQQSKLWAADPTILPPMPAPPPGGAPTDYQYSHHQSMRDLSIIRAPWKIFIRDAKVKDSQPSNLEWHVLGAGGWGAMQSCSRKYPQFTNLFPFYGWAPHDGFAFSFFQTYFQYPLKVQKCNYKGLNQGFQVTHSLLWVPFTIWISLRSYLCWRYGKLKNLTIYISIIVSL